MEVESQIFQFILKLVCTLCFGFVKTSISQQANILTKTKLKLLC